MVFYGRSASVILLSSLAAHASVGVLSETFAV
jgi:hypothetical protein